jgi:negative regulator of sigma-B (phosphoserine phosphatase)
METLSAAPLEYAAAGRTHTGEAVSGDRHLVRFTRYGALLAVVDGLGHGQAAGDSADIAIRTLERHAEEPSTSILRRCHSALAGTRGVAVGIASIRSSDGGFSWLSVGSVAGVLRRTGTPPAPPRPLSQCPGIVGVSLPKTLDLEFHALKSGDSIVLATDGIRRDFADANAPFRSVDAAANAILERHARGDDDALVIVARFLGMSR